MLEAGGKADNSFTHAGSPPYNPVNLLGFSFGTAFPFWFHDDCEVAIGGSTSSNNRSPPASAATSGKSARIFPPSTKSSTSLRYYLTMNMFYHPIYIDQFRHCRAAIDEALRYMKERKIRALHLGSDGLTRWWTARSQTKVAHVVLAGHELFGLIPAIGSSVSSPFG